MVDESDWRQQWQAELDAEYAMYSKLAQSGDPVFQARAEAARYVVPERVTGTPMIIDTDIGGDPDDAFAVILAARCVPELKLVITGDEFHGQRARFARYLLDLVGRSDVAVVSGAQLGETKYFCVGDMIPESIPQQQTDVIAAVKNVCDQATTLVRWVGMAPLTNLSAVITQCPELKTVLKITQMGGAINYRKPDQAEHNIRLDPLSARHVIHEVPKLQMEMIISDTTWTPDLEITPDSELYQKFRATDAPRWAQLIADHCDAWFERFHPGTIMHDPLTLSAAMHFPFVDSKPTTFTMADSGIMSIADEGITQWLSCNARHTKFIDWITKQLQPSTYQLQAASDE